MSGQNKPKAPTIPAGWGLPSIETAAPCVLPRRYLTVSCDDDGPFPGIVVEIAALSLDEAEPLLAVQTYDQLAARIAPWVRAWNIADPDVADGVTVLPAPATAGARIFDRLDKGLLIWLRTFLIQAPLDQVFPVIDAAAAMPPIGEVG